MGLNPEIKDKPVAFALYEQCNKLGLPLVQGGIVDQPHIWLEQYAVCAQREQLWRGIIANATNKSS